MKEHCKWLGPEVMFGLMYEQIKPGDTLLDVGIGTGASSILFHRAGLQVCGVDSSEERLRACESKRFTADLKQHDICTSTWPYPAGRFDHVVSLGVLNHFGNLEPVFEEVGRIIKGGGLFGFTFEARGDEQGEAYVVRETRGGGVHFQHAEAYIGDLLAREGLVTQKNLVFLADRRKGEDIFFSARLALKAGDHK